MQPKFHVLIVDPEGIVRSGLDAVANRDPSGSVEISTITDDVAGVIESLRRRLPDVRTLVLSPVYDSASAQKQSEPIILSEREREVMKLIAHGLRTREIADKLSVSGKTVEKHRTNLMRKLGVRSAAAVAAYAISNGYLIPEPPAEAYLKVELG